MNPMAIPLIVLAGGGVVFLAIDLYFIIRHRHPSIFVGMPANVCLPPLGEVISAKG